MDFSDRKVWPTIKKKKKKSFCKSACFHFLYFPGTFCTFLLAAGVHNECSAALTVSLGCISSSSYDNSWDCFPTLSFNLFLGFLKARKGDKKCGAEGWTPGMPDLSPALFPRSYLDGTFS